MDKLERYCGCLFGFAAGDALGTAIEFEQPGSGLMIYRWLCASPKVQETVTIGKLQSARTPLGLQAALWVFHTTDTY